MATFLPFEIAPILMSAPAIMAIREENSELTVQFVGVVLELQKARVSCQNPDRVTESRKMKV